MIGKSNLLKVGDGAQGHVPISERPPEPPTLPRE